MKNIYCLMFDGYETLDLMGAVAFLYRLPQVELHYVSLTGGTIRSTQAFSVETQKLVKVETGSVLVIPGGQGTRQLVNDNQFIAQLTRWVEQAEICLTVCTGSALLALTKQLNGFSATSNKRAFEWVKSLNDAVHWQPVARWVKDGKFYTSSGVSAGMDMTLGFIADYYGTAQAQLIANQTEYYWSCDPKKDDFAPLYGYQHKSSEN